MDEENILGIIEDNFKKYNINSSELNIDNIKKQLIVIEKYFANCTDMYNEITKELEKINLSVRGICRNAGIGKSTIYKEPYTLRLYIESRIKDLKCNVQLIQKDKLVNLQKENGEIRELLDKTIIKEIQLMNIKNENQELKEQLVKAHKDIQRYQIERVKYLKENEKLASNLNKNGKIIEIDF